MLAHTEQSTIISHIYVRQNAEKEFAEWQSKLHGALAPFNGFVSLEIISPNPPGQIDWKIIQRFQTDDTLKTWRDSAQCKKLFNELKPFLLSAVQDEDFHDEKQSGVTEVFVTQVAPKMVSAYQQWIGKVHQAEAKFPGFQRVYVQSPRNQMDGSWITMLQFDTPENLDRWLASKERKKILEEGKSMIRSLESHRVASSFAGWFSNLPEAPPVWKQTMLVLLVLFPVVMLELKFLSPLTRSLNPSLGTFMGNAISVALVSWPLMPIAIYFLGWWLNPGPVNPMRINILGTFVLFGLYLMEIGVFWML